MNEPNNIQDGASRDDPKDEIDLLEILQLVFRNKILIVLITFTFMALFLAYSFSLQRVYEAKTVIIIDPSGENAIGENNFNAVLSRDNSVIDSEVEIIKSSQISDRAALKLGLEHDPDYKRSSFFEIAIAGIKSFFIAPKEPDLQKEKQGLLNSFRDRIEASRVGLTYAIRISYWSYSPERAATVANRIADSYIDDQIERHYETNRKTNEWLSGRLRSLGTDVRQAEQAIEIYKRENDIVDTDKSLLSDQQLSELSSQLIIARSKTAEAKAKYDRIKEIVATGNSDGAVNDAIKNRVVTKLREEYSKQSRRAAELRENFGEGHNAYLKVAAELERINAAIIHELTRISEAYRSDFEVALSAESALETNLEKLKGVSVFSGRNQVQLRELERQAEASRSLYNTMLDAQKKSSELSTLPEINARIIELANPPLSPSFPSKSLFLLLGAAIGFILSLGIVLLRHFLDDKIWIGSQLNKIVEAPFFGHVPKFNADVLKLIDSSALLVKRGQEVHFDFSTLRTHLLTKEKLLQETLRSEQLSFRITPSADEVRGGKVVSHISALPSEGKTILNLLLSVFLAGQGLRVLLVDCDFRKRTLSKLLCPSVTEGIAELCFYSEQAEKIKPISDTHTPLDVMPSSGNISGDVATNLITQGLIEKYIDQVRHQYDFVIIDLPPIYLLPDADSLHKVIDHYVFASLWGKVSKKLILNSIQKNPHLQKKVAGMVLNQVDMSKLKNHGYGYGYGYHQEYSYYYGESEA